MKFSDLSLDAQHQLLVNLTALKIACFALSNVQNYLRLNLLVEESKIPESWAAALGALATSEVLSMSQEERNKVISQFDEATIQACSTD